MNSDAFEKLTSLQNPKVKQAVRLRDRRERDKTELFLIEGYREILRAQESEHPMRTLFICPELFLGTNEQVLIDQVMALGAKGFVVREDVFRKISYRDRPDGLLAIAPKRPQKLSDLTSKSVSEFFVVAEAIEKPGNLGTILRSSDAAGVDGLIVADRTTDIYNPNVVRASVGTLFTVPVVEESGKQLLNWLKEKNVKIVSATPSAETFYTDVDLTGPIAIAFGTEQLGLSKLWMDQADFLVKIPMLGKADSLNVAMAATLLMYEVVRQRRSK